jgi:hypothetical protein
MVEATRRDPCAQSQVEGRVEDSAHQPALPRPRESRFPAWKRDRGDAKIAPAIDAFGPARRVLPTGLVTSLPDRPAGRDAGPGLPSLPSPSPGASSPAPG